MVLVDPLAVLKGDMMRKHKYMVITWLDASYQIGPYDIDELTPMMTIMSAGFLVCQDKKFISLALDYDVEYDRWKHIGHIPKINIIRKKILVIKVPSKKPRKKAK